MTGVQRVKPRKGSKGRPSGFELGFPLIHRKLESKTSIGMLEKEKTEI